MKKSIFLILMLSAIYLLGCTAQRSIEKESHSSDIDLLEGSWQLASFIDHAHGDTAWSAYPENIIYQKHITPTHFIWQSYDKNRDMMTGSGGGTYTHIGDMYVEDIHFFYPPGSSISGQTIPFTVEMKDGKWHHTGYSKELEFDAETGEMVVVDSTKIEEIWERVEALGVKPSNDLALKGTWELVSYMEPDEEVWTEYPSFVGYLKHITPTHFVFVKYNAEGDELMFEGGGTYSLNDDTYTENISFMHPTRSGQVGTQLPFFMSKQGDNWFHTGFIKITDKNKETGETVVVDSSQVREIWRPYHIPTL